MSNRSPIYNLLHQQIKSCADHLLAISKKQKISSEKEEKLILERLKELHQFASKLRPDVHYHPLSKLKYYLENTVICYQDEHHRLLSIRLLEAISLLKIPVPVRADFQFKSSIVNSLKHHFLDHFFKDVRPGGPLFRKLIEIKKI